MKVRINRWYNTVLTALLTMLGYGCSSEEPMDMYGVIAEYGCPSADYIIKGTVMSEAGTPILGIKTSLKQVVQTVTGSYVYGIDSVQTSELGAYQLKSNEMPAGFTKLIVEDIDGEANGGEFLSDTLDIDYGKAVKLEEGDGKWYAGTFEISQDVKLKKK